MSVEATPATGSPPYGFVVIGRNEGERLKASLGSIVKLEAPVVYVDSGSTDGSQAFARSLGVDVVDLDMSVAFTAARARNSGFERLRESVPGLELVHFVDGDCVILDGWLEVAMRTLLADEGLAAVCGRRLERFPEATPYNTACDIEWDTPVGEAMEFGGEVLMRVKALEEAGLYNPKVIAAEDTDLAIRMRKRGWRLLRVDQPMSLHDADIQRFSQWWKRMVRGGHGTAENQALHGDSPHFHRKGWVRSAMTWGVAVPVGSAMLALPTLGTSVVGAAMTYGAMMGRTGLSAHKRGLSPKTSAIWAANCTLGKVPEALGSLQYWKNRLTRTDSTIIEYK